MPLVLGGSTADPGWDRPPDRKINGPGHGHGHGQQFLPQVRYPHGEPSVFSRLVGDEKFLWGLGIGLVAGWAVIPRIF